MGIEIGSELDLTQNAIRVLERRYLKRNEEGHVVEQPEDMFRRVARNIAAAEATYGPHADVEVWENKFYELMASAAFMPNSPTLMNAGRHLQQLSACFVLPVEDSMESIFDAIKSTALIHKSGGGTGFSFSNLRPKDDIVHSTKGISSGPVSFMKVFDAATEAIKQGGTRRGANMAILRVDHPDILEFINAKQNQKILNNFNLSVGITDAFMEAVEENRDYSLNNPRSKEQAGELSASQVFDLVAELAWQGGDPGVIFLDRMNRDNPTPHIGEIESTNPCGEQPLLPYESCNLGSICLSSLVSDGSLDWQRLGTVVDQAVRFLDDVIEVSHFPIPEIEEMTKGNRKIGLGVMGFADMLIQLGIPYDSVEAVQMAGEIMRFISQRSKEASSQLAKERGVFPNFEGSIYDGSGGMDMRNATTTTIAPTGTISIIAGCSSGVEPLFAVAFARTVLDGERLIEVNPLFEKTAQEQGFMDDELMEEIVERGTVRGVEGVPEEVQRLFATAHDISPEWHVRIQAAFQRHTDNAVSKTINFPNEATPQDVKDAYWLAYKLGCKGITIYRDGSREVQVLTKGTSDSSDDAHEEETSPRDSKTGKERAPRARPTTTQGTTERMTTGCGRQLYVTVNEDEHGLCEVFIQMGKSGGCIASQTEAVGRLVSLALRSGIKVEAILKHLRGIRCPAPSWQNGVAILSCADAIGQAIESRVNAGLPQEEVKVSITEEKEVKELKTSFSVAEVCPECPECGSMLEFIEGCAVCRACGYSQCG